eukprot:s1830_g8.t1
MGEEAAALAAAAPKRSTNIRQRTSNIPTIQTAPYSILVWGEKRGGAGGVEDEVDEELDDELEEELDDELEEELDDELVDAACQKGGGACGATALFYVFQRSF